MIADGLMTLFLVMLVLGIALYAAAPKRCEDGYEERTCVTSERSYPCRQLNCILCFCKDKRPATGYGRAGISIMVLSSIAIVVLGIVMCSFCCGCCGCRKGGCWESLDGAPAGVVQASYVSGSAPGQAAPMAYSVAPVAQPSNMYYDAPPPAYVDQQAIPVAHKV